MANSRHDKLTLKQFITLIIAILIVTVGLLLMFPYTVPKAERTLNRVESRIGVDNPIYHHFLASGKESNFLFPSKAAVWGDTATSYYYIRNLDKQKFNEYFSQLQANGWKDAYPAENKSKSDLINECFEQGECQICISTTDNKALQACITYLKTPVVEAILRLHDKYETKKLSQKYNLWIEVSDNSML